MISASTVGAEALQIFEIEQDACPFYLGDEHYNLLRSTENLTLSPWTATAQRSFFEKGGPFRNSNMTVVTDVSTTANNSLQQSLLSIAPLLSQAEAGTENGDLHNLYYDADQYLTFSVYVKLNKSVARDDPIADIKLFFGGSDDHRAHSGFNLETGEVVSGPPLDVAGNAVYHRIEYVTNGWWLLSVSSRNYTASTSVSVYVWPTQWTVGGEKRGSVFVAAPAVLIAKDSNKPYVINTSQSAIRRGGCAAEQRVRAIRSYPESQFESTATGVLPALADADRGFLAEAWVLPDLASLPSGGNSLLGTFRFNGGGSAQRGWAVRSTGDQTLWFQVFSPTGVQAQVFVPNFFPRYAGQWVHVAAEFEPGVAVRLYINGNQEVYSSSTSITSVGSTDATNGDPVWFLCRSELFNSDGVSNWRGNVSEMRFWRRDLLPAGNLSSFIVGNMRRRLPRGTHGLTHQWRFTEKSHDAPSLPFQLTSVHNDDLTATAVVLQNVNAKRARTLGSMSPLRFHSEPCYNLIESCRLVQSYQIGINPLRFVRPRGAIPTDFPVIPSLASVSHTSAKVNTGSNSSLSPLGARSTADATIVDHPYSDALTDKYREFREHDPIKHGTFWTKMFARWPYFAGRNCYVYSGYYGEKLWAMHSRQYILENIEGPDAAGRISVSTADIMKSLLDDRAVAPKHSGGLLESAISEGESLSSFTVESINPAEYPAGGGTLALKKEVMTYTSTTVSGNDVTFNGVQRSQFGTRAQSHSAGDTVQLCWHPGSIPVWEALYELLTEYGGLPKHYIPFESQWEVEALEWIPSFNIRSWPVTKPTGVEELVGELLEQCLCYLVFDERQQLLFFRTLRGVPESAEALIDQTSNIAKDSFEEWFDAEQRITQVVVHFLQVDPTERLNERNNYRTVIFRVDGDAQDVKRLGDTRIRNIFARFLLNDAQALMLAARMLTRYARIPRIITLRMHAKDGDLWLGDITNVLHHKLVDESGRALQRRFQVLGVEEARPGEVLSYEMEEYAFIGRFAFWMAEDAPVWTQFDYQDGDRAGFWSDEDGLLSDSSSGFKWQ